MTTGRRGRGLVRSYVVTDGRARPSRDTIDVVTLVMSTPSATASHPEKARIVALCAPGALSVAEVAAHLSLPISVTKILVADLVDDGCLTTRGPVPLAATPDIQLLQDILDGLRALG